jgi:hypothetical protein
MPANFGDVLSLQVMNGTKRQVSKKHPVVRCAFWIAYQFYISDLRRCFYPVPQNVPIAFPLQQENRQRQCAKGNQQNVKDDHDSSYSLFRHAAARYTECKKCLHSWMITIVYQHVKSIKDHLPNRIFPNIADRDLSSIRNATIPSFTRILFIGMLPAGTDRV